MESKQRFKAVREYYNLSMRSFGEKLGLTASSVSAIEYGTRVLSEKHVKLICAAFPEISENWLRTGEGEMFVAPSTDGQTIAAHVAKEYGSDPLLRAIMTTYLQLDDAKRALLMEIVEGFSAALKAAMESGDPAPDVSDYIQSHGDPLAAARSTRRIPLIQGADESEIQMRYQSQQEQRELEQSETLKPDPT